MFMYIPKLVYLYAMLCMYARDIFPEKISKFKWSLYRKKIYLHQHLISTIEQDFSAFSAAGTFVHLAALKRKE